MWADISPFEIYGKGVCAIGLGSYALLSLGDSSGHYDGVVALFCAGCFAVTWPVSVPLIVFGGLHDWLTQPKSKPKLV
jgi:hypothetical protein